MSRPVWLLSAALALVPLFVPARMSGDTLKFSHKLHVEDVGVGCVDCHTSASENTGGGKTNHTGMDPCRQCHEEQIDEKNCGMCHSNANQPGAFRGPVRHPRFSHKAHLDREVVCAVCHNDMAKSETLDSSALPGMKVCFTCHNDKRAPHNCGTCHQDGKDILPASHKLPGFKTREHGSSARYGRQECGECHQERFCDGCHHGQLSTEVHPLGFRYTHGFDARRRSKECRSCHDPLRFCSPCHEGRR